MMSSVYRIVSFVSISSDEASSPNKTDCSIYKDLGKNDLSINDIVVRMANSKMTCIKARFSLAIKVEEALLFEAYEKELNHENPKPKLEQNSNKKADKTKSLNEAKTKTDTTVLGYLPLDTILNVDESCSKTLQSDKGDTNNSGLMEHDEVDELEMIVTFECGKLTFVFKQDENSYHVSSIKGVVKLDSSIVREFISDRPVFFTSDLKHHFKYNDLIEVNSMATTKALILTANFYHTEIEPFRNTSSRDFIRPPDDNSKPFKE